MAKPKSKGQKSHPFRNKLLLNQWLVSLFGINPLIEHKINGKMPFHKLAEPIRDSRLEGLDKDNLHFFYHHLGNSPLEQVIQGIQRIKKDLEQKKDDLLKVGDLNACNFGKHLFQPHGLLHEGPACEKVLFHKRIKDVEQRLQDPTVILNSFILSWTQYPQLKWDKTQDELEDMHVLFMTDGGERYVNKLFAKLKGLAH